MGEKLAPGLLDHYLGKTAYQSQQVEEKRSPSQNRLLRTSLQNLAASWFSCAASRQARSQLLVNQGSTGNLELSSNPINS